MKNEAVEKLLEEAMREYVDHQSWRCEHAPHYYMAAGPPADGDCPCGLIDFRRRVAAEGIPTYSDEDES